MTVRCCPLQVLMSDTLQELRDLTACLKTKEPQEDLQARTFEDLDRTFVHIILRIIRFHLMQNLHYNHCVCVCGFLTISLLYYMFVAYIVLLCLKCNILILQPIDRQYQNSKSVKVKKKKETFWDKPRPVDKRFHPSGSNAKSIFSSQVVRHKSISSKT